MKQAGPMGQARMDDVGAFRFPMSWEQVQALVDDDLAYCLEQMATIGETTSRQRVLMRAAERLRDLAGAG